MKVSRVKFQVSSRAAGNAVLLGMGFVVWVAVCLFFIGSAIGLTGCTVKPTFQASIVDARTGKETYRVQGTWNDGQSALARAAGPVGAMLAGLIQALTLTP